MDHYPPQLVPPPSKFEHTVWSVTAGVFYSTLAGGIFGGLAAVCMAPDPFAFFDGGMAGGICGLACSPAFVFAVYQRARGRSLCILFGITLVVSVVFGAMLGPASAFIAVPTWLFGLLHLGSKARTERRFIEDLRNNLCTRCKYDLSGNATGRCPECGQVV